MAAIILVRSSTKRLNLPCIRLKASMMACISRGPRAGMAIAVPFPDSASSALLTGGMINRQALAHDGE
jgi:hypothetical protein